jgi:hypothetical protein
MLLGDLSGSDGFTVVTLLTDTPLVTASKVWVLRVYGFTGSYQKWENTIKIFFNMYYSER